MGKKIPYILTRVQVCLFLFLIMEPTIFAINSQTILTVVPNLRPVFNRYKEAIIQAHSRKQQRIFIERCQSDCIIPKSMLPSNWYKNLDIFNKPFTSIEHNILDVTGCRLREETEQAFLKVRSCYRELRESCADHETLDCLGNFYNRAREVCTARVNIIKRDLDRKLDRIFNESRWVKYSHPQNIRNTSQIQFKEDTLNALGLGLNFAVPMPSKTVFNFLKNFHDFEKQQGETYDTARGYLLHAVIDGVKNTLFPRRYRDALTELKKREDIVITKADKGNTVVILDRLAYEEKLRDLLSDGVTYEKLSKNPLKEWQRVYNRSLGEVLGGHSELKKRFTSYLPSLPHLYGLPKTHKEDLPLRPIISSRNSVTYKLSKWLSDSLSPLLGKISHSHIVNSSDFLDKIRCVDLSHKVMFSFDVDSLFTKVPVCVLFNYLREYLSENHVNLPVPPDTFMRLLFLCVDNCSFECNGNFYRQKFGLPMGSCLSPVLSNLFMEFFETKLLPSIVDFDLVWYRYVDDVFAVMPDNIDVDEFLSRLNTLSPSINFKLEKETNNCLPFLDTCISRSANNNVLSRVYRKPTHTDMYIHAFSNHRESVKLGCIIGLFLRAYRICDSLYIEEEINYLFNVFERLGYSKYFIDRAHRRAREKFYVPSNKDRENFDKVLLLPSNCNSNSAQSLFKQPPPKLVYKSDGTMREFLRHNCTKKSIAKLSRAALSTSPQGTPTFAALNAAS